MLFDLEVDVLRQQGVPPECIRGIHFWNGIDIRRSHVRSEEVDLLVVAFGAEIVLDDLGDPVHLV